MSEQTVTNFLETAAKTPKTSSDLFEEFLLMNFKKVYAQCNSSEMFNALASSFFFLLFERHLTMRAYKDDEKRDSDLKKDYTDFEINFEKNVIFYCRRANLEFNHIIEKYTK